MAYTVTNSMTVLGNKRVNAMYVLADAASATIQTGLKNVDFFTVGSVSMTTAGIRFRTNATAAGTSTAGSIGVSGATSGDVFWLVAYGH